MSCCGRGGAWFESCAGAGNIKLYHTWNEGIQACKAQLQSKLAFVQQGRTAPQKSLSSSSGGSNVNSTGVVTVARPFTFMTQHITAAHAPTSTFTADVFVTTNSKVIAVAPQMISASGTSPTPTSNIPSGYTSITYTSTNMLMTPDHASDNASVATQGCDKFIYVILFINLVNAVLVNLFRVF